MDCNQELQIILDVLSWLNSPGYVCTQLEDILPYMYRLPHTRFCDQSLHKKNRTEYLFQSEEFCSPGMIQLPHYLYDFQDFLLLLSFSLSSWDTRDRIYILS